MQNQRSSGIELLRIICISGIIFMHTFGSLNDNLYGFNREISIFINALFNTGVSCFILVSGYFGIRFNIQKLIQLDLVIIFYSFIGTVLAGDLSAKSLILSCFPIISRKYWFLSCYFALCFLAPFLNKASESIAKKSFSKLILILLLILSIIPTFAFFELTMDGGKGIAQMIMLYLIGRYIKLYFPQFISQKKILGVLIICLSIIFLLDSALSILKGVQMGTFCRDCSIFIIISAICLLLLFREFNFYNTFINHIAGNVMPLYVFESFVRIYVLNRFVDLTYYIKSSALILYVTLYVFAVIVICMLVNEIRRFLLSPLDAFLAKHISSLVNYCLTPLKRKELL